MAEHAYQDRSAWRAAYAAWKFAGKWRAETDYRRESGLSNDPTDDALRNAFKNCAKPPKPEVYPLVREQILGWSPEPPRLAVPASQLSAAPVAPPLAPLSQPASVRATPRQGRGSVDVIPDLAEFATEQPQ